MALGIDAKCDGHFRLFRVYRMVQPCESVLIAVYLCLPETWLQNGIGWLLPKVTCLPIHFFNWIHYAYAWVISAKI